MAGNSPGADKHFMTFEKLNVTEPVPPGHLTQPVDPVDPVDPEDPHVRMAVPPDPRTPNVEHERSFEAADPISAAFERKKDCE